MVEKKKKDELFEDGKKEETTVAKKSPTELATTHLKPAPGTEDIGDSILLPRYKILQSTSQEVKDKLEGAEPGRIKNNVSDEVWDTIQMIPMKMFKTRTLFDADNRDGAPLCRSNDGKVGTGAIACDTCEHGESSWKEGTPPDCSLTFNYLCIDPEDKGKRSVPVLLSLMRTGTQAARRLNTPSRIQNLPFWCWVWEVATKEKKFRKGEAFIPVVKQVRETTEEERKWAAALYQSIEGKKIETEDTTEDLDEKEFDA